MQKLMARFRSDPPAVLAGLKVIEVLDYLNLTATRRGEQPRRLEAPKGDMVMLMLSEPGNYVAVRPSGTEPKVKFYQFTYVPAEQLANLADTKREMAERLKTLENDLKAFAGVK
jgi:phosphoglucomutase/phosphomannomutase